MSFRESNFEAFRAISSSSSSSSSPPTPPIKALQSEDEEDVVAEKQACKKWTLLKKLTKLQPHQPQPKKEEYFRPMFSTITPRDNSDKYYLMFIEALSMKYMKVMELCDRLDARLFDVLWSMLPEKTPCFICQHFIERSDHKKIWWNFPSACIYCPACVTAEDVRAGNVTLLASILSPGFGKTVAKNLEKNPNAYDRYILRFRCWIPPDLFAALNGLRRYTSDAHLKRTSHLRDRLYDAHMSNFAGKKPNMIQSYRNFIMTESAQFKMVDAAFSFALRSLPNHIPKICCKCGTN